jgi:hypothetical protein
MKSHPPYVSSIPRSAWERDSSIPRSAWERDGLCFQGSHAERGNQECRESACWMVALACLVLLSLASKAAAQAEKKSDVVKPAVAAKSAKEPEAGPADKLSLEERRIAEKYKHLEDVLLRMAELNAATDPRRAALLKKAVAQSKDELISVRFERLVELLGKDQLSGALENQAELDQDLHTLLELLMSENRSKRIENEKARIREYLKELNTIIKQERDIQGRTAGDDEPKRLAGEQRKVADKTGDLAKQIQKNEEKPQGKKAEGGKGKGEDGKRDGKGSESKDGKDKDGKGKDGKGKPGKGKPGKGKPGKESDGKAGESQGKGESQGQQNPNENPARKRLEAAQQRMNDAEAKLKEAQRQGAVENQEEALRELEQAKSELEEILRQLREEEIERILAMLESRFRKMLQMQEEVYEGTVRLDKIPAAQRTHNHEIEASRLSGRESQIVVEVDKAALVLREEGSAVAFPEAIEQMRDDMQQVVLRLAQTKVDKITQGVEEDIIAALKDMITALKKARKEQKNKKPPSGSCSSCEPPLIDTLAELKMIRALQMRVNIRTARYSKMIEGEQAENPELVEAIRRLAERQQRIYRVTRDLELGKNQ